MLGFLFAFAFAFVLGLGSGDLYTVEPVLSGHLRGMAK